MASASTPSVNEPTRATFTKGDVGMAKHFSKNYGNKG